MSKSIAHVDTFDIGYAVWVGETPIGGDTYYEKAEQDAQAINAAVADLQARHDDLLAALERLVITRQHSALAQARAAIAKAHGETP